MICYNGEDLPKPLALIGAPFVGKVEKGTLLDVLLYGRVFASIFLWIVWREKNASIS